MKLLNYIFFTLFICNLSIAQNSTSFQDVLKKIQDLREQSNHATYTIDVQIQFAKEALALSKQTKVDTVILKSDRNLSMLYLQSGDFPVFKRRSFNNLQYSKRIQDTASMAHANYYLGFYYQLTKKHDSAYYYYHQSAKFYNSIQDAKHEGEVLSNMATIQETERDYVGSESNAIKSIALLESLPKTDDNLETLWNAYSLIAVISAGLEEYDNALAYYDKTLEICDKMQDSYESRLFSNINIAALYRRKGDFITAERLYRKLYEDTMIYEFDPSSYAIILSGLAYVSFKNNRDTSDAAKKLFERAYAISEEEEDFYGLLFISIDKAEYFLNTKNIDSARYYANNAYTIARQLHANESVLETLLLQSKIETGEKAKASLDAYITLSDSLQKEERLNRNKFARINYETDQIKAAKDKATKERFMFLLISIGLLLTLGLLYIIFSQRTKNKELQFIQQQQETNEEIYNLMLSQQNNIDEARDKEKRRISQELHDGILGRLFGARLSLDSLNRSATTEAINSRENYIVELQAIEQEIRKVSHELNTDFISGSGFTDIIKSLLENQTKAYNIDYTFTYDDSIPWDAIANKTKIHIYRILQESLQNIYKHANATKVIISFTLKKKVICMTITDDGSGFNINKAKKGIGIKNITSRAKEIDAEVTFQSHKNKGTSIIIHLPI